MPPTPVPASRPSALVRWLPTLGLLVWTAGAVGGWLLARRAGWGAGELVLAGAGWLLVLLVAARQLLRDLFGPVFVYEVIRVGRRTSTFAFRWVYIGLLVGLLALMYYAWSHTVRHYGDRVPPVRMAEFATLYFEVVAVAQFVVVVLLTPGYVAAAISNEKERQTLEFLLATDLRNREIVFGKLAARAITLIMYVLAGLPLIAFLQLFGGIDPDLALASAAAAVLVVFGLSAVSLMFSTAAKKSRDAIAVTYLVVIGYIAVSLTLAIIVEETLVRKNAHLTDLGLFVIDWGAVTNWFAAGNPIWSYPHETQGGKVDGDIIARLLGRFAVFWGSITVLCLGYAVTRLRVIALRQSHGVARTGKTTVAANRPEMGNEPVLWREVFGGSKRVGVMGWLFRTVIVGLVAFIPAYGAYACFWTDNGWRTFDAQWRNYVEGMSIWVRVCTGVLGGLALFAVALRGAAAVAGERDKDTWISLISAPLTPQAVLAGKFFGCVLSVRFLYWVLIGVWAVGLALGAVHPLMLFVTAGLLALYVSAFSLIGIVCSLWAKTTLGASVRALIGAAVAAGGFWLAFLLCCVLPIAISGTGDRVLSIPATLLLGGTPPFMVGWAPMQDFDREGLGPFHPNELDNGRVGPLAPVLGTVVWIGITLLLATAALGMLTREMNRQPKEPPPPRPRPREKAARVAE